MATLSFLSGGGSFNINNLNGSGLGFYGSAFGNSVEVGSYQDSTFITDGNGTVQMAQVNNCKWTHPSSGSLNGLSSISLVNMPNHLATLNVRFTHDSAVRMLNEKVRIFDRSNINNNASGVTTKVAEIAHPSVTQTGNLGSGSSTWNTPTGSSVVMSLAFSSPGLSGHRVSGPNTTSVQHDYYFNISASPDSVGSKNQYGFYFQADYV